MMMMMTMCIIIMVIVIHNVIRALGFLPCEQTFLSCMAFNIYEVICVACLWCTWFSLCPPRNGKRGVLTKLMAQQTSHANNFVNAKSSAREKLLLAGYGFPSIFFRAQPWKHYGARLNYYAFEFFFALIYCVVMLFTTVTLFVFCRTMNTFLIVYLIVLVSQGALCAGLMFWKQGTKSGMPSYVYLEKPKVTVSELSSLVSLFMIVGHVSLFSKKIGIIIQRIEGAESEIHQNSQFFHRFVLWNTENK